VTRSRGESGANASGTSRPASAEIEEHCRKVRAGDRRAVAKAITLLESTRSDRAALGEEILEAVVSETGGAIRVGITGPPGVGKSTFIEALGLHLIEHGHRVAVLAVDPSSPVTGGSILGDKTRMERLSQEEAAFIRPSPSGGALGGVAHRTREAMLLCEAAGYDVVLIETVGIGQSEISVRSMVDLFALLLQPGAGDQLQGIKKGVLELADALVVSSLTGEGIPGFWRVVLEHREALRESGEFQARRRSQAREWTWTLVGEGLQRAFREHPEVASRVREIELDVEAQRMTPAAAARILLDAFRGS
jgi:LAO/AO transport system kinase